MSEEPTDRERAFLEIAQDGTEERAALYGRAFGAQAADDLLPYRPESEPAGGTYGRFVPFSEVEAEPVRWLIPGLVPRSMVTILAGDPKLGKSTLTMLWAAQVSTGAVGGEAARVLVVNCEDVAAQTVKPRLLAAGGDVHRIGFHELHDDDGNVRPVEIPGDAEAIRKLVKAEQARLVVIDPLNAVLDGRIDSHKDASLRRGLAPLSRLAEDTGAAIVLVTHFSKSQAGGTPIHRLGGSVGYGGVARSVLAMVRHPEDEPGGDRRLLIDLGSTNAGRRPSIEYRQESAEVTGARGERIETNRLVFVGESGVQAEDALRAGPVADLRSDAGEAIVAVLADGEEHDAHEVKAQVSETVGCSSKTVERAADRLEKQGVLVRRGEDFPCRTLWRLRSGDSEPTGSSSDRHLPEAVATDGTLAVAGDPERAAGSSDSAAARDETCRACGSLLADVGGRRTCFHCAASAREDAA